MTDKELNKLESKAKKVKNGHLSVHYDPQVQIDYWVNVEDKRTKQTHCLLLLQTLLLLLI